MIGSQVLKLRRFYHYFRGVNRIAISDGEGSHSYNDLYRDSSILAQAISSNSNNTESSESPRNIGILVNNDSKFVKALWSVWRAGRVGVPLCPSHPTKALRYFIQNSGSDVILASEELKNEAELLGPKKLIILEDILRNHSSAESSSSLLEKKEKAPHPPENNHPNDGALILYTSGTTGAPKGVWINHGNVEAQVSGMVKSWAWTSDDHILHVLPLHHVHGLINCLLVPLSIGASVKMLPGFDAQNVWSHLTNPSMKINVFMAVPTIYSLLTKEFETDQRSKTEIHDNLRSNYRLMVCGSASLPEPLLRQWQTISGHVLLERYGMTEIGMALGNSLEEDKRLPGLVGTPFPNVEARIVSEEGSVLAYCNDLEFSYKSDQSGELQIRGPSVFSAYYNNEKATNASFDPNGGWFLTGDTACMNSRGAFKILGRTSADIIKSGGFKLSALEIEREYLSYPDISEIAVVGLENEIFGEIVAAVVVPAPGFRLTSDLLKSLGSKKLPPYSVPREFMLVDSIAKNNMGKINKKELKKLF